MSKSGIRRKHTADATQLCRRLYPASPTYKEGPPGRANGRATHNAHKERHKGPHVSQPAEDEDEGRQGGVGRPHRSAEPGLVPIQVHFEEESWPRHLITFHMCIWREPTSRAINRGSLHPPQHTQLSFHSLQEGSLSL